MYFNYSYHYITPRVEESPKMVAVSLPKYFYLVLSKHGFSLESNLSIFIFLRL